MSEYFMIIKRDMRMEKSPIPSIVINKRLQFMMLQNNHKCFLFSYDKKKRNVTSQKVSAFLSFTHCND